MSMQCKYCCKNISVSEFNSNKGYCKKCYEERYHKKNKYNTERNSTILAYIFMAIPVLIIILIISSIVIGSKQDAERRKQKELMEFNTQLHQDPSTWDKEQRDRYDSFTKWDSKN